MMNSDPDREATVKKPPKFKGSIKWKPWKESVISYFNSSLTKDFIPLSYFIRVNDDPAPDAEYDSEHQRLVAIAPHRGTEFKHDNGVVFDFLKTWTINGPAYPWMKQFDTTRNGRATWLSLLTYYEGTAARDCVKEAAYAAKSNAKYYGEKKKFSFDTYVNIHQEAYQDLHQNDETIPEDKRVRDLLTGIKDASLNAAKQTIMAMPTLRTDFAAAVSHLATSLQMNAALLPDVRNISTTTSSGRGGGRGSNNRGRGRGRGKGRGNGGRNIYLGNYNAAQWRALSVEDKKKVREGCKRSAEQQSHTPTTINVSHVTTANQDPDAQSTVTTPTAVITRADTENAGSAMTHRWLNAITTGIRGQGPTGARSVAQVRQQETQNTVFGTCELDSHADTCVAGPNCRTLEDTGFTVSVTGFSDKLHGTVTNVPIVKAATAYDDPLTGTTYILVLGQAIYMGDSVEATLLCPNQLRYQGIVVDDCPKHLAPPGNPSTHSLFIPENQLRICFKMKGPVSVFDTRMPTKDEISTCRWVTLTGDEVWDPHSESFQAEEEKVTYHDDYFLGRNHDSRTIMSLSKNLNNISDIFDDYLFINRYVSQVATGIKKPKVSKEQLAQRWGIGLSAAENTIKVTPQKGIRNLTGHIDRRLKTKQAHSRYKYLSGRHGRFYTDTFFHQCQLLGPAHVQNYIPMILGSSRYIPCNPRQKLMIVLIPLYMR